MFERFTAAARLAVVQAQDEARQLRHPRIGTEHLLLGVLSEPTMPASQVLARIGLDHDRARRLVVELGRPQPALDAAALDTLGIDLGEVRRRVEASFGPGALDDPVGGLRRHLRFSPRAKKVLELSLRECIRRHDGSIGTEHLVLGILREGQGLAAAILAQATVDRAGFEAALAEQERGGPDAVAVG